MITAADNCLSRDELRDFALGRLPESRLATVASHLETCINCEDTISSLDGTADSLVDHLQIAPSHHARQAQEYLAAMQKMKSGIPARNTVPTETPASDADCIVRDYKLVSLLGAGGMGTVYKAVHTKLDRIFALKLLSARRIGNAEAIARFEREMKAIGKLDHPVLVRATDAGEEEGQHFLAMEYVDGFDLAELLERHGPLSVPDACEIIRQAATGLQHVHAQNLVHRDIKPSNLMVTTDGQVKILDLGLALLGEQQDGMDELTTVGQMMGTVDYMAPEQCDDSHDVDIRADIYSVGATLFRMLTGTAPFATPNRRSPLSRIRALATEEAPRITERLENVPPELDDAIHTMLMRQPENRFQTPDEVLKAIEPFTDGHDLTKVMATAAAAPAARKTVLPAASGLPQLPPETPGALPPSNWNRVIAFAFGAVFLAFAGIVFRLQTDKGQLVVECKVPNVEINLLKDGEAHQELSLNQGETSLSVYSGNYEIVIPGSQDSVDVSASKFTISRGSKVVATIQHVLNNAHAVNELPDTMDMMETMVPDDNPTYSGQSFQQWKRKLADRDHLEMSAAMKAIGILGVNHNAAEAGQLIFDTVKHDFRRSVSMRPRGSAGVDSDRDLELRRSAVQSFRPLLDDPKGVEILRSLLTNGDTAARRFAICVLDCSDSVHRHEAPRWRSAQLATVELVPALITASHDEDVGLKALFMACDYARRFPGVADRCLEIVESEDFDTVYRVAETAYHIVPKARKQIGERFLKFYNANLAKFRQSGTSGGPMTARMGFHFDRMEMLHVAIECGTDPERTTTELLSILQDSKEAASHRAQAAYLLAAYPHDAVKSASTMTRLLDGRDPSLQNMCQVKLYEFANPRRDGGPFQHYGVRTSSLNQWRNGTTLQMALVKALGNLGADAETARGYLNSIVSLRVLGPGNFALSHPDVSVVKAAVESLAKIGMKPESIAVLKRLSESGLPPSGLALEALLQVPPEQMEEFRLENLDLE